MACGSTKCRVCNNSFPACQLKDGMCAACRKAQAAIPPPKVIIPNQLRTY